MVEKGSLGGTAADGNLSEAGCTDSYVADDSIFDFRKTGEGDFGDCLGVAGADFAGVGYVAPEGAFYFKAVEKLVRTEGDLFISQVEVTVGEGASACGGDEGEHGIVSEESGGRVGGGRGVDDVAAESTAVLVGNAAGPTGGLGEQGEVAGDD